ncbi:DegT/DnrJ/EryC1/StrS family aminotransferase [Planctomicrobium sp. SH668]|uniref:DegT/DnrJ/EryC1/StrS family aminotransferase n=1 Tax=Planctomicrobium sp. SH668 TaxID=3448126 RepID=UPI003F5AE6F0
MMQADRNFSKDDDSEELERLAVFGGSKAFPEGPDFPMSFSPACREALVRCADLQLWNRYEGEFTSGLIGSLKQFLGVEHVLLCSSGTSAVELALRGVNVQEGDEVILAASDFKGNFLNILALGATPVLVDVAEKSAQLDVTRVEAALTEKTRVVIATHLHGGTVDMRRLCELADQRQFQILEDACQMPGAIVQGRRAGTWGDVGVVSFGGSKLLSAGRSGAIFSNRDDIAARVRRWKIRGSDVSPMSELQASVITPQLESIDSQRKDRNNFVQGMRRHLGDEDAVELVASPFEESFNEPDFYKLFLMYRPERCNGLKREAFVAALRAEGVPIAPVFRGLHCIHSKSRFRPVGQLENATRIDEMGLVLHHPILLRDLEAARKLVETIQNIQRHSRSLKELLNLYRSTPALWEED